MRVDQRIAGFALSGLAALLASEHLRAEEADIRIREAAAYFPLAEEGMLRIDDKAYVKAVAKWPKNQIRVCWEAATPRLKEHDWVESAVRDSWEKHSKLRFQFSNVSCASGGEDIRIAVGDFPPAVNGLGTEIRDKPGGMVLNFLFKTWRVECRNSESAREECVRAVAVHEFGHALGFAHEQNRPDTPGECQAPPDGEDGTLPLTPWDKNSVMNYCNPKFNNGGKLSSNDIDALNKFYGGLL